MSGREMNATVKRPMGLVAVVVVTGIFAVIDLVFHLPPLLFAEAGNRPFWLYIQRHSSSVCIWQQSLLALDLIHNKTRKANLRFPRLLSSYSQVYLFVIKENER